MLSLASVTKNTTQVSPVSLSQLSGPSQGNPNLCFQGPEWVSMLDFQVRVREEGQFTPKSQGKKALG